MATSTRTFLIELYEEYLSEASFLYEQRLSLSRNPEITWKHLGEYEERLEAHIDGLVIGDRLALDVCFRRAVEGDFGELYAAMCVFCRQGQRELALSVLKELDLDDSEKASAVGDALKYELPDGWSEDLIGMIATADATLAPLLARAFGYRRTQCGLQLMSAMKRCPESRLPEICWALGRITYRPAIEPLRQRLDSKDESVCLEAANALLRMGDRQALEYCFDQARSVTWPVLPLVLAGGRRILKLLAEMAEAGDGPDCVTALGLIGDPHSVPLLLSRLENPETAALAASALDCMTAAGLSETVFVPDEIEEDELFDSEREQLGKGKAVDRGDGQPYGSNVTRISQNPEDWNRWWKQNGSNFKPDVRYRYGHPLSPGQLVSTLAAERTPHLLRRYCSEELVTRYGKDFGLETDMPVDAQLAILSNAAEWSASSGHAFQGGAWYFAGAPI